MHRGQRQRRRPTFVAPAQALERLGAELTARTAGHEDVIESAGRSCGQRRPSAELDRAPPPMTRCVSGWTRLGAELVELAHDGRRGAPAPAPAGTSGACRRRWRGWRRRALDGRDPIQAAAPAEAALACDIGPRRHLPHRRRDDARRGVLHRRRRGAARHGCWRSAAATGACTTRSWSARCCAAAGRWSCATPQSRPSSYKPFVTRYGAHAYVAAPGDAGGPGDRLPARGLPFRLT